MFSTPPWVLREEGFDPSRARHVEGLFTQGSGYLHLRGSLEEPLRSATQNRDPLRGPGNVTAEAFPERPSRWGAFVPGVFANHPRLGDEMVNLPCFLLWTLEVDGEVLDAGESEVERHRRSLDLRDGLLRREVGWRTRGGARIEATFLRMVSAARPHVCFQRLELAADRPVELAVTALVDADVRTNGFDHFSRRELAARVEGEIACRVRTDGGDAIEILAHFAPEGAPAASIERERSAGIAARMALDPGAPAVVLEKRTAITTSRDLEPRPTRELLEEALRLSWDEAVAENRAVWEDRWRACAIEVVGDPRSRTGLRTSLYHLLRCQVAGDDRVAIDAKGYAGEAYYGRFFWDTEVFLLPFYLYTDPARARELVGFRLNTLEGARANARREGCRGARYAWESSTSGVEQCPAWPYAEQEVHVTADVVYGLAHYARAADPSYLGGEAAEAIVEVARWWLDRIETSPDGSLALTGVLGPDEYTPSCADNAYTNRLAAFALGVAAEVGEHGGADEGERARFLDASRRLPIPRSADGAVLQCRGFDELPEPDFEALWRDRSRPLAAQVPEEELYAVKALKQADVLAMMALFPTEFDDATVLRAWDDYLPWTTHDSSLSASVHALVACRLGKREDAWRFWTSSRDLDVDPGRGGAAEGVHVANAAGTWMGVVFGFAGVESAMWTETLSLSPRLPRAWGGLCFPLVWRGVPVRIEIDRTTTRVHNDGGEALEVRVAGAARCLPPGESVSFATGGDPDVPLEAVLFDLDGVLVSTDHLHFEAWRELTGREGIPFDWELNHRLRGLSRRRSLEVILEAAGALRSELEMEEMLEIKNELYRASLGGLGPRDVLPGGRELLRALRDAGVATAVVSSSRNARDLLVRTALLEATDLLVDGNDVRWGKPDPEGFLLATERLGVDPARCVVIEDAPAGVEAARGAGAAVVAIGDPRLHPDVLHVTGGLEALTVADLRAVCGVVDQRGFQARP